MAGMVADVAVFHRGHRAAHQLHAHGGAAVLVASQQLRPLLRIPGGNALGDRGGIGQAQGELCREQLGWKKSTTYTVLKKLCGRGLLRNENSTVTVLAPREAVTAEAAGEFVDKAFGGSLPGFLAAFMSGRRLSEQEAEELKRLIDAHKEG